MEPDQPPPSRQQQPIRAGLEHLPHWCIGTGKQRDNKQTLALFQRHGPTPRSRHLGSSDYHVVEDLHVFLRTGLYREEELVSFRLVRLMVGLGGHQPALVHRKLEMQPLRSSSAHPITLASCRIVLSSIDLSIYIVDRTFLLFCFADSTTKSGPISLKTVPLESPRKALSTHTYCSRACAVAWPQEV